jgi:hypothetical protein
MALKNIEEAMIERIQRAVAKDLKQLRRRARAAATRQASTSKRPGVAKATTLHDTNHNCAVAATGMQCDSHPQ